MMAWCQGTMQQKCKCHVNSVKFLFPIFFCNGRKQLLQKTEEDLSWGYMSSTKTESKISPTQSTVVLHE